MLSSKAAFRAVEIPEPAGGVFHSKKDRMMIASDHRAHMSTRNTVS
jgi:hypothetical protein